MTPFHCLISNFEKKNCSIEQKTFFPEGNLIELSTFLKYGLTEVLKATS